MKPVQSDEFKLVLKYKPSFRFFIPWVLVVVALVISRVVRTGGHLNGSPDIFKRLLSFGLIAILFLFLMRIGLLISIQLLPKVVITNEGIFEISFFGLKEKTSSWNLIALEPIRYLGANGVMASWGKENVWISERSSNYEAAVKWLQEKNHLAPGSPKYIPWADYRRKQRLKNPI
jgi:hypothetical protein